MYRDWDYWGKPVPNFGDPNARILIIGLAPAAHGANRTGRMFTGDESGNWLFQTLYEVGLANQPTAVRADDGLELKDILITASVHCAPPANKPTPGELANCLPFLLETLQIVENWRVMVALGRIGFIQTLRTLKEAQIPHAIRQSSFAHGAELQLPGGRWIVCSYHPSQQNTFTGKLTREMMRSIFTRAKALADG
ncbi:MAG: uracil-DNA glycosylase [Armatimonadetes bacterium]|nr:uracil-DNA glycosylase [Armatimonadota bacterium]